MDPGDWIFYGIIAASVVSSIVKAVSKKPGQTENTGMPDFKGSRSGDIIRTILQDLEKEDDYIPSNPKPAPSAFSPDEMKSREEKMKRQEMSPAFANNKTVTEKILRNDHLHESVKPAPAIVAESPSDPILQKLDLKNMDELKKAIIYSEIIRPKF